MALPINPAGIGAYGKEAFAFVTTIANTALPSLAEINAASSLNMSCILYEGSNALGVETEKVTRPRRVCDTQMYQSNGPTTYTLGDLSYVFGPQAAAASDGKKAIEKLPEGTTGYLVRRQGLSAKTVDFAIGQFVDMIPIEVGIPVPTKTSEDPNAEFSVVQAASVTSAPVFNKALLA